MKGKWAIIGSIVVLALLVLAVGWTHAQGPQSPEGAGVAELGGSGAQGSAPSAALGSAFTYQGQLKSEGTPVNDTCDFQFGLWDAVSGGTQVGTTQTKTSVPVSEGYFTIPDLDFGATAFQGDARWLEIAVRCPAGSGSYTTLSPRQALTAAPYALSLRPGAEVHGPVSGAALRVQNTATGGITYGVYGRNDSTPSGMFEWAYGVYGYASATSGTTYGVSGYSASPEGRGVSGFAAATSGTTYGVYGVSASTNGRGVYGYASASSDTTYGVFGECVSTSGRGVAGYAWASSGYAYGVYGWSESTDGAGVYGAAVVGVEGFSVSTNGTGVVGIAVANGGTTYGIFGSSSSTDGTGVYGQSPTYGVYGYASATSGITYGVSGQSASIAGRGVDGYARATSGYAFGVSGHSESTDGRGVYGYAEATSGTTYGVYGASASTSGRGVYGYAPDSGAGSGPGYAGYFSGDVHVQGTLSKSAGAFRIDHPLDPANKYLNHSFVESPDMKNVYDGVVLLDSDGEAWVQLPEWFEALNRDFRYQLTCIGGYAPVYIAQEVQDNRFRIAGGIPGMKVSWQVTGIRHDPFAEQNRIPVEEDKPADERGTYLYPQGYGQPQEMGLDYRRNPRLFEEVPEPLRDEGR